LRLSHFPEFFGNTDLSAYFCGTSTGVKELRPSSTTENSIPELLPITLDAEAVPAKYSWSQAVAAAAPEIS